MSKECFLDKNIKSRIMCKHYWNDDVCIIASIIVVEETFLQDTM